MPLIDDLGPSKSSGGLIDDLGPGKKRSLGGGSDPSSFDMMGMSMPDTSEIPEGNLARSIVDTPGIVLKTAARTIQQAGPGAGAALMQYGGEYAGQYNRKMMKQPELQPDVDYTPTLGMEIPPPAEPLREDPVSEFMRVGGKASREYWDQASKDEILKTRINSFTDIKSIADGLEYGAAGAGNLLGSMALVAGTGGVGSGAAKMTAGVALKEGTKRSLGGRALEFITPKPLHAPIAYMEGGEIAGGQLDAYEKEGKELDPLRAAAATTLATILEGGAGAEAALGKFATMGPAAREFAKRTLARRMIEGGFVTGGEEGAEEFLQTYAEKFGADPSKLWTKETLIEGIDSFLQGMAGGHVMGTAGGAGARKQADSVKSQEKAQRDAVSSPVNYEHPAAQEMIGHRASVARDLESYVSEIDPQLAREFGAYATEAIRNNQPIDLSMLTNTGKFELDDYTEAATPEASPQTAQAASQEAGAAKEDTYTPFLKSLRESYDSGQLTKEQLESQVRTGLIEKFGADSPLVKAVDDYVATLNLPPGVGDGMNMVNKALDDPYIATDPVYDAIVGKAGPLAEGTGGRVVKDLGPIDRMERDLEKFPQSEPRGPAGIRRTPGMPRPRTTTPILGGQPVQTATPEQVQTLDAAAHEAATSPLNDKPLPSQKQIDTGVYEKGHYRGIPGLDISIENPKGSTRSGVSPQGKPWQSELKAHYGYIRRTEGADGDHVDTFIGPNPASDRVFVVYQNNPATGKFDEHKVMLGYNNIEEAKAGYLENYEPGWKGMGSVVPMSMDSFKAWLKVVTPITKEAARPTKQKGPAPKPVTLDSYVRKVKINFDIPGYSNKQAIADGLLSYVKKSAITLDKRAQEMQTLGLLGTTPEGVSDAGDYLYQQLQKIVFDRKNKKQGDAITDEQQAMDQQEQAELLKDATTVSEAIPDEDFPSEFQFDKMIEAADNNIQGIKEELHEAGYSQSEIQTIIDGIKEELEGENAGRRIEERLTELKEAATSARTQVNLSEEFPSVDEITTHESRIAQYAKEYADSGYSLYLLNEFKAITERDLKANIAAYQSRIDNNETGKKYQVRMFRDLIYIDKNTLAALDRVIGEPRETPAPQAGNELFNTDSMFTLSGSQPVTPVKMKIPEKKGERLVDVEKQTTDELKDRLSGEKAKREYEEGKEITQEPWQMTREEFSRAVTLRPSGKDSYIVLPDGKRWLNPGTRSKEEGIRSTHQAIIQQALSEGKHVPEEVLQDYPDLNKKVEATNADPLAKLKQDLENKGVGRIGKADYKILDHDDLGYTYTRTVDGVKIEQGGGYPSKWSREYAIERALEDAEFYTPRKETTQPKVNSPTTDVGDLVGDSNKVFTKERADKAREILRKKLNQLNVGIDPEILTAGLDLAGYYIEAGSRKFKDFSFKMVEDLGEKIRPYLKSFYLSVRNYPGFENEGMQTEAELDKEATDKPRLTYKEFSDQYRDAFERGNKYTPKQAGFRVYSEKMAELADDYPEFMERFDKEVEERVYGKEPAAKAEPHDGWRDHLIKARAYAKDLGIVNEIRDWTDLKEIVSVIDNYLSGKEREPTADTPARAAASSNIADWVVSMLDKGQSFTKDELFERSAKEFGGTMAEGIFNGKDAFDALEMGINRWIMKQKYRVAAYEDAKYDITHAQNTVDYIRKYVLEKIPSQTGLRSEEQDEFQQFSTPPDLAYVMAWVAKLTKKDTVLEPSAGIGGIAMYAKNTGSTTIVNELSKRRAEILKEMGFDKVYTENAEQIYNILHKDLSPSVVLMNPPFSSTAGRVKGQKKSSNVIQHLDQALKLVQPGGRMVALIGKGWFDDPRQVSDYFTKIKTEYNLRAIITIDGKGYAKYGTTYDNRILVIDKTAPENKPTIEESVDNVRDAIPILKEVRDARRNVTAQQSSAEQEGQGVLVTGEGTDRPVVPVRPATGRVGDRKGTSRRPNGDRGNAEHTNDGETGTGNAGADTRDSTRPGGNFKPAEWPEGTDRPSVGGTRSANERAQSKSGVDETTDPGLTVTSKAAEKATGELTDSVYESYTPQKVVIEGAKAHPGKLVESAAMSIVEPPTPTYSPKLPAPFIKQGKFSLAQLEAIVYAGQAHSQLLPQTVLDDNGDNTEEHYRRGYFIGDGTGVGKGREITGIIWDNYNQGRKKSIWISQNAPLISDARRDVKLSGWNDKLVFDFGKSKLGQTITVPEGICFLGYDVLKTRDPKDANRSRLNQLVEWFGKDYDGVIVFDESHNLANAIGVRGTRGTSKPSQKAIAGLELQRLLPKARVVYVSATGATEVSNLAYADRLGLWGEGTSFASKVDFITQIASGGIAAMEFVARDMKALGNYIARSLSYEDVKYDKLEHKLTADQREIYDELATAWQGVLGRIDEALAATGGKNNGRAKSVAYSAFWGSLQRFFNQVITSMQTPSVVNAIEEDLKNGRSVVIQLVNTNEAGQGRALARMEEGDDLEDLDLTPRDQFIEYVRNSFPVAQYQEQTDHEGNTVWVVVVDSNGNPVENPEAVAMREELIRKLQTIRVPDGPLEMILNKFGTDKVGEVTGRTRRVVRNENGEKIVEKWSKTKGMADADNFMADKKQVLIFSDAGGTGRSYHADLGAENQRVRRHYLLQAGWRADRAIQGFGRTHRTNQKQAPEYILVTTDVIGQKRFISSIARRLDQLGALTKGQRETGSGGFFTARDNLESVYAQDAITRLIQDMYSHAVPGWDISDFIQQTGLNRLVNKDDGSLNVDSIPLVPQFLNRLLAMNLDKQVEIFELFSERLDQNIRAALAAGTLDVGLETLRAKKIEKVSEQVVHTDERSGAQTKYVQLGVTRDAVVYHFNEVRESWKANGFYRNIKSGQVWAASATKTETDANTGVLKNHINLHSPRGTAQSVDPKDLADTEKYEKLRDDPARALWENEYDKSPKEVTYQEHFITGALLPIWDRINGKARIMRVQTADGERMIGRLLDPKHLTDTLRALGATAQQQEYTPDNLFTMARDQGFKLELSNGWVIKRAKVAGEYRMEITGPDYRHEGELSRHGVFQEQISWKTRYFIPTNDKGVKSLEGITKNRPIVNVVAPAGVRNDMGHGAPAFRKVEGKVEGRYKAAVLEKLMKPITSKVAARTGVKVVVVQNNKGFPVDFIERAGSDFDPNTTKVYAAYDPKENVIYLVADNLDTTSFAEKVLFEELVGHKGIRAFLGKEKMDQLRDMVYRQFKNDPAMAKVIRDYELDVSNEDDRLMAGDEFIAHNIDRPSLIDKVAAFIRDALRQMGFKMRISDAELKTLVGNLLNRTEAAMMKENAPEEGSKPSLKGQKPAAPFYSQLARTIENKANEMPGKAQSIIPWLQKQGVKPMEIEEMDVNGWLLANGGGGKIDKRAFAEFVKANQVQIEEITKGGNSDESFMNYESLEPESEMQRLVDRFTDGELPDGNLIEEADRLGFDVTFDEYGDIDTIIKQKSGVEGTKYHGYILPGGSNYREMLFTLPQKRTGRTYDEIGKLLEDFDRYPAGSHERAALRQEQENAPDIEHEGFVSSHWSEPNVLGHVRMQDFTDKEGQRVLLVEEVQSDWHQQGKKEGYRSEAPSSPTVEVRKFARFTAGEIGGRWHVLDDGQKASGGFDTQEEAQRKADWYMEEIGSPQPWKVLVNGEVMGNYAKEPSEQQTHAAVERWEQSDPARRVPDAPLKQNWHEYLLKRMIRYASENGYDKLAWTPGEAQAERYDLSKQVGKLEYDHELATDTYDLRAFPPGGGTLLVNEKNISANKLADYVGKEVAQKIINSEGLEHEEKEWKYGSLSGLDLKVGGKGMKVFYDQLIPGFMNKYVKQWGAKVGETEIITDEGYKDIQPGPYRDYVESQATTIPSVPITPAMRDAVLYEGQPMYRKAADKFNAAFRKWFGDSKVVDENGGPLVVYHGTKTKFDVFDMNASEDIERGQYFTNIPKVAEKYGKKMEVFLSIQKPYRLTSKQWYEDTGWEMDDLIEDGYDGIIVSGAVHEHLGTGKDERMYIPFNANQIKATDNRGTWDTEDDRISFKKTSSDPLMDLLNQANPDLAAKLQAVLDDVGKQNKSTEETGAPAGDVPGPEASEKRTESWLQKETGAIFRTIASTMPGALPHNSFLENVLKSPEWYSHPVMKNIVRLFTMDRERLYHTTLVDLTTIDGQSVIEETDELRKHNPGAYKELLFAIDYGDTKWKRGKDSMERLRDQDISEEARNAVVANQVKKYEEYLRDKRGVSDAAIEVWKLHRASYDKALDMMTAQLRALIEKMDQEGITEATQTTLEGLKYALASMNEWRGFYAPRLRERAGYAVQADRPFGKEKEHYREHKSRYGAERLAAKLKEEGWQNVRITEIGKLPESVYMNLKAVDVAKAIKSAAEGLGGDAAVAFNDELIENVSNLIKSRGYRSSMIHRASPDEMNVVRGFMEDPLERYTTYVGNLAGGFSKSQVAQAAMQQLLGQKNEEGKLEGGIDAKRESRAYTTAERYIAEQLRNLDQTDRIVGVAKSIATLKYLGFNPRSMLVNMTAMVTTVPPAIHQYVMGGKGSINKAMAEITKAGADVAGIMTAKKKLKDADEQAFIERIQREGYDDPQLTRDLMGKTAAIHKRIWSQVMGAAMWMFGKTEQWNRMSTMLAGYRLARKMGKTDEQAYTMALDASNKAHGLYGRATLPAWAQGGNPAAKAGQLLYVYGKFGHNYLQLMYDLGFKKNDVRAFLWGFAAPLVVAGGAAWPLKDVFFGIIDAILRLLGIKTGVEKMVYDGIRKHFGKKAEITARHGLTGLAGIDISGSLSIGVGVPKTMWELTGAAGGVYEDVAKAAHYLATGQPGRAIEKALPTAFANPIRAVRESTKGVTSEKGRRAFDPETGRPAKLSPLEATARTLGFRPSEQAVESERKREHDVIVKGFTDRRDTIYEEARAYFSNPERSSKDMTKIMRMQTEYNQSIRDAGMTGLVPFMKYSSIRDQAKAMGRAGKPERRRLMQER